MIKWKVNGNRSATATSGKFHLKAQHSPGYRGTGYWQVNSGPTILSGGSCMNLTAAKRNAAKYVTSGAAASKMKWLGK